MGVKKTHSHFLVVLISVFYHRLSVCPETPRLSHSPLVLGTHAGCLKTPIIYPEEQITAATDSMRMCKNSDRVLNTAAVTEGFQSTKKETGKKRCYMQVQ